MHLELIRSIEGLYEAVVTDPGSWPDEALGEWSTEAIADPPPKPLAREIRRAIRSATKLRDYWSNTAGGPTDWRLRVDEALSVGAWRPLLSIAKHGLDAAPSPELFDEVKRLVAEVTFDRWMEGVTFNQWIGNQIDASER